MPRSSLAANTSDLLTIRELLKRRLCVPAFQRPFDWDDEQVAAFCRDLKDTADQGIPLFLGMIVLSPGIATHILDVIDGQQRLTTVMLAVAALGASASVVDDHSAPGNGRLWVAPRADDASYLETVIRQGKIDAPQSRPQVLLRDAWALLQQGLKGVSLDHLMNCQVIVYVAPSVAGATGLFERINLRGKEVDQFDLVKNRLIEWAGQLKNENDKAALVMSISHAYGSMYRTLNPTKAKNKYDTDRLLTVHWILVTTSPFKSGMKVIDSLGAEAAAHRGNDAKLVDFIARYIRSLEELCPSWVQLMTPQAAHIPNAELREALLEFRKLNRDAQQEPLILAALRRWPNDAHTLIRYCEIMSLRDLLASRSANFGRAPKWRLARELYQGKLRDARGVPIEQVEDLVHQMYWQTGTFWELNEAKVLQSDSTPSAAELADTAFAAQDFYTGRGPLVRYLFWNYGRYLEENSQQRKKWGNLVKTDQTFFEHGFWFADDGFRSWDVDHIYPKNPDFEAAEKPTELLRHDKMMRPVINDLGNLTVLSISDNRGLRNAHFEVKLKLLETAKRLPFNSLLSRKEYRGRLMTRPYWGPTNSRLRKEKIVAFASDRFGTNAIMALGVSVYDNRISFVVTDVDETNPGVD